MSNFEIMKKLHGSYKKLCPVCEGVKHVSKFKRGGVAYRICNECHIRNGKKGDKGDKL
jgi:hypothetical protein